MVIKQGFCPTMVTSLEECQEAIDFLYPIIHSDPYNRITKEVTTTDDGPAGCIRNFYYGADGGPYLRFTWNEAKSNEQCGMMTRLTNKVWWYSCLLSK